MNPFAPGWTPVPTIAASALRIVERFPVLGGMPTPAWMTAAIEANERRRVLVLEIAAMAGPKAARNAWWVACFFALGAIADPCSTIGVRLDAGLRAFRNLAAAGALDFGVAPVWTPAKRQT